MKSIYIAKIGKTVGLQGELKIHLESDFPEQFKVGASFTTKNNVTLEVSSFNIKRGTIKFKSINSIDDAKKLTNTELYSSYEDTIKNCTLADKQYFWFDIENCLIKENDQVLGKVVDVHRYPSSDYLEIKTDSLLEEKELAKTFMLPYIDLYILSVDIENKTITVKDALAILENS